jgi:Protein of unknown function (DUF2950)
MNPAKFILVMLPVAIAFGQPNSSPKTFTTAGEAVRELYRAVETGDSNAIAALLGGPTELASSADPAQDKAERSLFLEKYKEMHRLGRELDGAVTLYVGAENWPFPVPLVGGANGWHFDGDRGGKEVLYRRIGDNEQAAIATCHDFVAAQKRFKDNPNASNPLETSPESLVAKVTHATAAAPVLLNGYYYREIPSKDGRGFAFVAYPAQYRTTGVMTFVVTGRDIVYQKDLGTATANAANGMTAFHRDRSWSQADR